MVASDAVPKSQRDASEQENLDARAPQRISNRRARTRKIPGLFELDSIFWPAEARPRAEAITQKLIFFTRVCIYNEAARHSREHDQWRLSMRLSSFPVVVHQ